MSRQELPSSTRGMIVRPDTPHGLALSELAGSATTRRNEHARQLVAVAPARAQFESRRLGQPRHSRSFGEARGIASAENQRANGQVRCVRHPRGKQGGVEFSTTLAQQAFDTPANPEFRQGRRKIHRAHAEHQHRIRHLPQRREPVRPHALGRQDQDR